MVEFPSYLWSLEVTERSPSQRVLAIRGCGQLDSTVQRLGFGVSLYAPIRSEEVL